MAANLTAAGVSVIGTYNSGAAEAEEAEEQTPTKVQARRTRRRPRISSTN